jgi:hypothetical protein
MSGIYDYSLFFILLVLAMWLHHKIITWLKHFQFYHKWLYPWVDLILGFVMSLISVYVVHLLIT